MPSLISRVADGWMAIVWNGPLVRCLTRMWQGAREGAIVAALLLAYAGCMFVYNVVAHASLDVHFDTAELSVWAQDLALGYKHPPLSAWVTALWLGVFPQRDWSMHLLAAVNMTVALAVTWRLLRDHLDKDRALVGVVALILVPLYLFPAMRYNANTAMVPFWAAATLFFLRTLRRPTAANAIFAGVFTGLAFLGKYWTIYLIAGMAAVVLTTMPRAFWRTASPYLMGGSALLVVAPHLYWILVQQNLDSTDYAATIELADGFGAVIRRSAFYVGGLFAYCLVPWLFFVVLGPSRQALSDTIWPRGIDRQRAHVLFIVPLLLPVLINLVLPHRLTPLWTFPNWALFPVVLFGSPYLKVLPVAAARALIVVAIPLLGGVVVSPYLAYLNLQPVLQEAHYRQVAEAIERIAGQPVDVVAGSIDITQGVPFYMPQARVLEVWPTSAAARAALGGKRVAIVCIIADAQCASLASAASPNARPETVTLTRHYLGASGPPATYAITIVPPNA